MGIQTDNNFLAEDMSWATCTGCGCIQLSGLIDPEILYKTQHNPAIGRTWNDHNKAFSDYIISSSAKHIIDVGGANLKIANLVALSPAVNSYTVVDTAVDQYDGHSNEKINTIKGFIEDVIIPERVEAIVLSHTFEHFYNPVAVLKRFADYLTADGKVLISVPHIENQLKDNFTNALNFEHTFYINPEYMQLCAAYSGYRISNVTHYSKYNTFYTLQKANITSKEIFDVTHAKQTFNSYINNLTQDARNINTSINDKQVYCFGAHVFTQALLAAGLKRESIISVLDNDSNKIGHVLYGTGLSIEHPSVITNKHNPYVILRAAQYTQEIKQELYSYNSTVILL